MRRGAGGRGPGGGGKLQLAVASPASPPRLGGHVRCLAMAARPPRPPSRAPSLRCPSAPLQRGMGAVGHPAPPSCPVPGGTRCGVG